MPVDFANAFSFLDQFGITDILLPFVLIFTIVYAVLAKIKLFGEESKKYNLIIALGISLLAIIPHATGRYQEFDIVNVINASLPQVALILIAIVVLMVLIGLVGGGAPGTSSIILGIAGLIGVILLIIVFWRALFPYSTPSWLSFLDDPSTQALLIILVVFGLIVWFVTKEPGKPGEGTKAAQEFFKAMFGGK
ncbi:hypothetical protein HY493_01995 [Candidatus Woesearchaeota archaeon]|nr:hypothetical protein [Candidatus Woesearchaeota archaeon]